ncbi:hypothetical protein F4779DRAFT_606516 [Xylariaceae sp. FL0662B]|nr:hypothetical protein F4779DRAFT_606516 [Xylariaceae sp. FL0662B]
MHVSRAFTYIAGALLMGAATVNGIKLSLNQASCVSCVPEEDQKGGWALPFTPVRTIADHKIAHCRSCAWPRKFDKLKPWLRR